MSSASTSRAGVCWCLISDLYEDPDTIVDALTPLRFRGNDIIVFHILDPAEIDFTFDQAASFRDLESGDEIPVIPETFSVRYRSLIEEHIRALSSRFSENRIDYALFNTSVPLDHALFRYLSTRERLSRVR